MANKMTSNLSDSLAQEVKKTEQKKTNAWEKLDQDGQLSQNLKNAGVTDVHLDAMSQQELENIALGGTSDHEMMDSMALDGLDFEFTDNLDALLEIGTSYKLGEVKAKYPDKIRFFWASIAQNASHNVERFLASKATAYATVNDLAQGYHSIALRSADTGRIRIEEMVLLKTSLKHWERLMTHLHHELPSQSQSEIYDKKNKSLPARMDYEEESDKVFNPNGNSSIYGAARAVGAPKSGGWTNLTN